MSGTSSARPGKPPGRRWPIPRLVAALVAIPVLAVTILLFTTRPACACTPIPSLPASPLVGIVIRVDSAGLGDVRGFDLRLADGSIISLDLGPLENATEFSPSHLTEHQASSEPIRAFYRIDAGRPTVYRLEDASR